jgi:hypothetical protein
VSVQLHNRRPLPFEGRYLWHPRDEQAGPDEDHYDWLPRAIFDRLDGMIPKDNPRVHTMVRAYRSEGEALAAYDRAFAAAVAALSDDPSPEQMRADLAAWGIDTSEAFRRVKAALATGGAA